ncbi:hypothetical protein AVEN_248804-1 [Araneus ventricosus]|uniref:Uncharacterized protein n=1 Tax=Araneus ventricosus TaxID=182803 RepID=A0A4Y2TKS8_ARAVE|nr:hypothetical protein AVEN_248804-1 [Araneus ventricosus]
MCRNFTLWFQLMNDFLCSHFNIKLTTKNTPSQAFVCIGKPDRPDSNTVFLSAQNSPPYEKPMHKPLPKEVHSSSAMGSLTSTTVIVLPLGKREPTSRESEN